MIDKRSGRARLLSSLRSADGKGIVHIEDRFDTNIDDLWSALADPARLGRWLGEFEGDLRLAGGFRARFFASEWEGTGHVEVCDPPRHLLVLMTETGATYPDATEVTLSAEGEQTVLVVEQRGLPRDQLAAYGAGLQIHVEDLAAYLVGSERCDARARWKELFPSYAAKAIDLA
jgi:uncharacterized protein YndB with AHSA1/START domain